MNKQFYLFTALTFYLHPLAAQTNLGSRLAAMGNQGAAIPDLWGVMANPATISTLLHPTAQLSHITHGFSTEIRNQALALGFSSRRQALGLSLHRYGLQEYSKMKIGIVTARQFGPKLAIGMRANYHQLKIENYGFTAGASIDVGAYYQFTTELSAGFYMDNLSKQQYHSRLVHITIPSNTFFGMAYRANSKLLLAATVSKEDVAVGMDYQLITKLSLRSGISLHPYTHYFGLGFNTSKFLVDFALSKHSTLGYSPQLTIGYVF